MKSSKTAKPKRAAAPVIAAAPAHQSYLWWYVVGFLITFFGLYEVYSPALNGPFLLDDSYLPYMLPNFFAMPLRNWIGEVRPVLMFSFWLNFKTSGNEVTFGYHVVNVILHFLNGALIYLIVRKALSWVETERPYLEILAIFAGALFLLHPIQTESVTYVASRSETLSVFFVLAAFAVFVYRKNSSVDVPTALAALVLFGFAVLSKEHTGILPAVFLLTDYYWNPGFTFEGIRRNWKLYAPVGIGAALGIALAVRVLSHSSTAGFRMKDLTWYQYFFTQCRVIWDYLRLYLLPAGQNLDYDLPFSRNVFEHGAMVGLMALLAVSVLAWVYRKRFKLASYGWFTFLILLAPTSSFVPIRDPIAERRLYLPFIGLLFITVDFLRRWKTGRTTIIAVLSAVLVAEAALTYQRNQLWASAIDLWKDTVAKSPNKVRPRFQLAFAYYQAQHCSEAVDEFAKAAKIEPPTFDLLIDWALAYDCTGDANQAIARLRQAAAINKSAHVYSQIGMEYGKQGKYADALDALATAEQLNPRFAMTYVYRGNIYEVQHNAPAAAQQYRRALAADPYNQPARDGLVRLGQ